MATNSEISAAIVSAEAAGVSYAQLASLIKRAIAAGLAEDGRLVVSSGVEGSTITFSSLDAAIAALEKIQRLARIESNGGGVAAACEFTAG